MPNLQTKYATCPKSPSHETFKERVEIRGESWLMLDPTLSPIDLLQPHEFSVTRRSVQKVCSVCGSAVITRLPF